MLFQSIKSYLLNKCGPYVERIALSLHKNPLPKMVKVSTGQSDSSDKKMGNDAAQLYAFCRLLDDMADGDIDNGPERLLQIKKTLS